MRRSTFFVSLLASSCGRESSSLSLVQSKQRETHISRRRAIAKVLQIPLITSGSILVAPTISNARNLPQSTGADLNNVGTVEALTPIVRIRQSLKNDDVSNLVYTIPREEQAFKRVFDEYSDPVSYKQKYLDSNAFVVYYTRGFDGPNRPTIEEDLPERQTLQYGTRNEAWIAWQDLQSELQFAKKYPDEPNDVKKYLDRMIAAIDAYLQLAPPSHVEQATRMISKQGNS